MLEFNKRPNEIKNHTYLFSAPAIVRRQLLLGLLLHVLLLNLNVREVGVSLAHLALHVLLGEFVDGVDKEGTAIDVDSGTDAEVSGRVEIRIRQLGRAC
jgi:hypothetical protein